MPLSRNRPSLRAAACCMVIMLLAACSVGPGAPVGGSTSPSRRATPPVTSTATGDDPCGRDASPPRWRHVVWIVMENKAYNQIVGSPDAPYENRLAAQCGLASAYHAVAHPSLPNYIAMTSGGTQDIADDDPPSAHPLTAPSIFSQLGSEWRALQESMPSACDLGSSGAYVVKHNPAAYFTSIRGACRSQDIPLEGTPDLSARFTFVTPNLCNDMHDCPVTTGDSWLASFLPSIFGSPQYRSGKTAVFLTYDEDDGSAHNQVATFVIAPSVPPGTRSAESFTHYSLLRTTEEMLGVGLLGAAASAASMRDAFRL